MIKICIIGTGRIVKDGYLPAILSLPELYNLVAICNRNHEEEGIQIADKFGFEYFNNVECMLKAKTVDTVIIASHAISHYDNIRLCLTYGKKVIVEKPIVTDLTQAQQIKIEHKYNNNIYTSFQRRFNPLVRLSKKLIDSNLIGTVRHVICTNIHKKNMSYYERKMYGQFDGGGVLINQSIHSIDLIHYLLGEFNNIEYAYMKNDFFDISVEDTFISVFNMSCGAKVTFFASTGSNIEKGYCVNIMGALGTILLNNESIEVHYKDGSIENTIKQESTLSLVDLLKLQLIEFNNVINGKSLSRDICSFDDSLLVLNFVKKLYQKAGEL